MNSKNLGVIFGPSLIRPRPTTAPITISSLAEYSNQARLVEFLITYSQKVFDGSLQPQDVALCSTGSSAPQGDQGCHLKPLLSPGERDPEHFMKSLFFSSKEVSFVLYVELCWNFVMFMLSEKSLNCLLWGVFCFLKFKTSLPSTGYPHCGQWKQNSWTSCIIWGIRTKAECVRKMWCVSHWWVVMWNTCLLT